MPGVDGRHPTSTSTRSARSAWTRCQKLAKGNAIGLIPRSRSQMWLRNQAIRMLPYMPWKNLVAGGVDKAVNAITLGDYPA